MDAGSILGREGCDRATGFTGAIIAVQYSLGGCTKYLIAQKAKDDEIGKEAWFGEGRVAVAQESEALGAGFGFGNGKAPRKGDNE